MASIVFNNVNVVYLDKKKHEIPALVNFTCEFENGKCNVVLGESGCGKTTLLRCLTNQVNYGGNVLIDERESSEMPANDKNMSIVHQSYSLYPRMTVFDNMAFPLKIMKYSPEKITSEVIKVAELLNLSHCLARKPKELSGGQQQKVALGRALIKNPDIILFDEPLSNIDKDNRIDIIKHIKNINKTYSTTIIYVTHNISEALMIADNVYVIENGSLAFCGTKEEFLKTSNPLLQTYLNEEKENA